MSTASIFQVSASMQAEGFDYATFFNGPTPFGPFQVDSVGYRPFGSLFFSKIGESWMDDDDATPCVAPEYYDWMRSEEFGLPEHSQQHLMFAEFDTTELVEYSDNRFGVNGPFRKELASFLSVPHWPVLTTFFSGIHVDPSVSANSDVFFGWEVDTVAIWNASVLTRVRVFHNSGTPWTYEV
jgi:hypothetical protein